MSKILGVPLAPVNKPGGEGATESLAVVKAGVLSVREGRHVDVAEILASGDS